MQDMTQAVLCICDKNWKCSLTSGSIGRQAVIHQRGRSRSDIQKLMSIIKHKLSTALSAVPLLWLIACWHQPIVCDVQLNRCGVSNHGLVTKNLPLNCAWSHRPLISMPVTLKQLFEKSQLLTTSVNESELPYIERRLDQIESQSKNLLDETSKHPQKPHDINSRAYVFVRMADHIVHYAWLFSFIGTFYWLMLVSIPISLLTILTPFNSTSHLNLSPPCTVLILR